MRPEDLSLLTTPGTVAVSGNLVLVSISTPDLDSNTYRGGLHRVFPDGTTVPWTHGARDNAQRMAPDGRSVAFLRVAGKSKPQLYVAPVDGGEPRKEERDPDEWHRLALSRSYGMGRAKPPFIGPKSD